MPSAPSRTAFATSVASARVGRGARIIDSSICVATIDGPSRRAGRAQQVLLEQRDLLHRQLHAQVAARDHHRVGAARIWSIVGRPRGRVSIFATIGTDAVAHQRRAAPPRPRGRERTTAPPGRRRGRARAPGPRGRDRSRRQAQALGRDVHPLAATDRAAATHWSGPSSPAIAGHRQLDRAVGEQDAVALLQVCATGPDRCVEAPCSSAVGPPG